MCWAVGALVAVPMWADQENHYRRPGDSARCICKFPYDYVSSSHTATMDQEFWRWWNSVVAFLLPGTLIVIVGVINVTLLSRTTSIVNDTEMEQRR